MKKKFLLTLCALFLSNVTYPYCDSWRDPDTNIFWYFVRTSGNTASLHKDDNDSEDIYPCVSLTHPTDVTIPTIVYYNDKAYTVTGIDDSAFEDASFLRSITIPNSVVSISGNVFRFCNSLSSIIVNEGNPTYDSRDGCNAIIETASNTLIAGCKSTIIPESVTSIGSGAFSTCGTDLTSITIPNSVTRILSSAFYPCSGLTIVKAMSPTPAVNNWAFSYNTTSNGTLYVPIGSKSAYESATGWNEFSDIIEIIFFDDASVKSICVANWDIDGDGELSKTEAAAVTDLGIVFKDNTTITSFNELQYFTGLTEINDHAFRNTIALTSVIIPENVTRIGNDAFGRWTERTSNLVSVQLPDGLIEIGEDAFWSCNKLKNINIPTNLRSIGDGAFHYTAIESLILPEGFLSIGNGACNYCNSLESIYIPSTVTHIVDGSVDGTFGGCEVLHSIVVAENNPVYDSRNNCNALIESSTNRLIRGSNQTIIPSGIVSIERQAFDFSNISQINIPSTVTTICDYAFGGCQYLKMVKVNSETPITITSDVFSSDFRGGSNIHSITLYVPNGCKAAYEAADYWKEFKNIIEFIEGDVNSDEEVDVLDVVDIVRYVVDDPADTFVPILADINANGEVNVGDVVALVNEIAGDQNFVKPWRAPQQNSAADEVLTLISTDNGMSLCMENERNYTAFQFDLYLPAGTDATDMMLNAQRKQGHQLIYNKVEKGHYRVAAISTSNHTFSGYEGELLAVGLEGIANEDICFRNIRFFTTDGEEHRFDDIVMQSGTATDIASPQQPSNEETQDIYDLQGRKMVNGKWLNGKSSKGIYIVNGKKIAF